MIRTVAGVMLAAFAAGPAAAQSMVWEVTSRYPYRAQIEFYSQDRPFSWPGGGEAYELNDSQTKAFELSCQPGELVCYGAWVTGVGEQYWGVGPDNAQHCEDCCAYCGEQPEPVMLVE